MYIPDPLPEVLTVTLPPVIFNVVPLELLCIPYELEALLFATMLPLAIFMVPALVLFTPTTELVPIAEMEPLFMVKFLADTPEAEVLVLLTTIAGSAIVSVDPIVTSVQASPDIPY